MTPSELYRTMRTAIMARDKACKPANFCIVSHPGAGKTSIFMQLAIELNVRLIVLHPAIAESIDFKGIPGFDNGAAKFFLTPDLLEIAHTEQNTIVLIDDFLHADESVQRALMQLVRGIVGSEKVSSKVTFILCTNDIDQNAGVSIPIEPLKSSMHSILTLEVSVLDWLSWASEHGGYWSDSDGIHPMVRAFIDRNNDMLAAFTPTQTLENSPVPRQVERVSDFLYLEYADSVLRELVTGACGKAFATRFLAFLRIAQNLPSPVDALESPESVNIPEDKLDLLYIFAYTVGRLFSEKRFQHNRYIANAYRLLALMPVPLQRLMIREIQHTYPDSVNTSEYIAWRVAHQEIDLTV